MPVQAASKMLKTALVSGASRGIGASILRTFLTLGYHVVGTAKTSAGVERIQAEIARYAVHGCLPGVGLCLDVCDDAQVRALPAQLAERCPHSPAPTIVVNNAAITLDQLAIRMPVEAWQAVLDTNLSGPFRLAKVLLKPMLKARWGRIINISSVVARSGNRGQSHYVAAKAGLEGLTRALACELGGRNITVNAIAPGWVETDMTADWSVERREQLLQSIPLQRFGTGDDVAAAVGFLASSAAAYITGAVIPVNGGLYCS